MGKYNTLETVASFNQFVKDFNNWLKEERIKVYTRGGSKTDVWVITPSRLFNKETTKLNRQILLRGVCPDQGGDDQAQNKR